MLKGSRYVTGKQDKFVEQITEVLPFLDHAQAEEYYDFVEPYLGPADRALLGCNDRYFLLTRMLGRKDARHPWIYDRCREVEGDELGHIDLWARYHYKSTIITFAGSIQAILCDPEITIGIFSATNKIAKPFLSQIKQELESNDLLKDTYPDVLWRNPKKEAPSWALDGGIVVKRQGNPKEATVEAFGLLDGMPTGRHFKRLVYDDLLNQEHVTNPEMIRKVTERWELSDNLGCGEGTEIVTVGTRYSFADTYGLMIERGVLKPRIYAATDNGRLDGKPVFMTPEHWEDVKNKQRSTVSAQMLQNPIAGQENIFRPEWFRGWEVRPTNLNVCILGDPSAGKNGKSDRTAIVVIGIDQAGAKYFLDGYVHRMGLTERWQALKTLYRKWDAEPGVVNVQVGYERYGMQTDLEYFQERMRLENCYFPIQEVSWPRVGEHSKVARVERLEPDIRMGRFFFPAIVYEPGKGDCYWHVDEKRSTFVRIPVKGPTKQQQRMIGAGHADLVCKSIRRRNEDGASYCVTSAILEELMFFPFGRRDDAADALSRIYDMEIALVSPWEDRDADALNSRDYPDA